MCEGTGDQAKISKVRSALAEPRLHVSNCLPPFPRPPQGSLFLGVHLKSPGSAILWLFSLTQSVCSKGRYVPSQLCLYSTVKGRPSCASGDHSWESQLDKALSTASHLQASLIYSFPNHTLFFFYPWPLGKEMRVERASSSYFHACFKIVLSLSCSQPLLGWVWGSLLTL